MNTKTTEAHLTWTPATGSVIRFNDNVNSGKVPDFGAPVKHSAAKKGYCNPKFQKFGEKSGGRKIGNTSFTPIKGHTYL